MKHMMQSPQLYKRSEGMKQPYEERYPLLFSPLKVRDKELRSRIITAPSCHGHITDLFNHQLNTEGVLYYGGKAKGGAAMITLEKHFLTMATALHTPPILILRQKTAFLICTD